MTKRSKSDLNTLFADNTSQDISAEDQRDMLDTLMSTMGGIYWDSNATPQAMTADTYAKIINSSGNMAGVNGVTADYTNNRLVATISGIHKVYCHFGASVSSPNTLLHASVYVNGAHTYLELDRHLSTANDLGAMSMSGPIQVNAGEAIELWIQLDGSMNITVKHAQLWAELAGD